MSRADAAALLASLPTEQRRAVADFLLDLVHACNTPISTLRLELFSARQSLAKALDDPAAELGELGEIADNLEAATATLHALVAALGDAASQGS